MTSAGTVWLIAYRQPRRRFDGQTMLLFLVSYALLRFVIEFLRADDRGALWGLSTSQWIGLAICAACALAWRPLSQRGASAVHAGAGANKRAKSEATGSVSGARAPR